MKESETYTQQHALNALPFRAYAHIWNEYYRDQNLQGKIETYTTDSVGGAELVAITQLRHRAWKKDYFTSAMTDTQKGGEVLLPIEPAYEDLTTIVNGGTGAMFPNGALSANAGRITDAGGTNIARIENLQTGGEISINSLRTSNQLQKFLERNARSGSRMAEFLLSHFSVKSDDLRLNRPQYLGGGKQSVSVSEVLTSFRNETVDLGEMGGHAISVGNTNGFSQGFKEYGIVMGLVSVIPEAVYMDGLPREFSVVDRFDYHLPEFANLGEQPIYKDEIFLDLNSTTHHDAWGYQSRYAEAKFINSTVHGDFRDTLKHWTGARSFAAAPPLEEDFIKCDTKEIDNSIFPVADSQATDKLYAMVYNKVKAVRPLPYFGEPQL